jgi:glutamate-1-semialdehyde 2,1-aminomutase
LKSNHRICDQSKNAFEQAKKLIPGGVNSPVRAFKSVGGNPLFIQSGAGSWVQDIDGNRYLDYVGSWGPLILGHAHPDVVMSIQQAASHGTSFGAPTLLEIEMAKLIVERVPSIEVVRMVNSGTEATMSAIRLSRGFTKRNLIVKFEGCYHGHVDALLIKAGSGVATLGLPDSPGVPSQIAELTLVLPYNDLEVIQTVFKQYGEQIAAVLIEPIAGNMGVVAPEPGYLESLRQLTKQYGSLLIFDEVMTGFRVHKHSAQGLYGVTPDLTCLGKVIGGGLPVGAYGGRRDIMNLIAPEGPIYQAGTLSGNPLAMAAGLKTLQLLGNPDVYEQLEKKSARLEHGFIQNAHEFNVPCTINRVGSMLCPFFTEHQVKDYATAKTSNSEMFAKYFRIMLDFGVYVAPSQYEGMFISLAHSDKEIEFTIDVHREALKKLIHES